MEQRFTLLDLIQYAIHFLTGIHFQGAYVPPIYIECKFCDYRSVDPAELL